MPLSKLDDNAFTANLLVRQTFGASSALSWETRMSVPQVGDKRAARFGGKTKKIVDQGLA